MYVPVMNVVPRKPLWFVMALGDVQRYVGGDIVNTQCANCARAPCA